MRNAVLHLGREGTNKGDSSGEAKEVKGKFEFRIRKKKTEKLLLLLLLLLFGFTRQGFSV